ncbi:unnamed protein product [Caenorhabditis auriculariae]|uniref:Uncharacterized protein n=1 Tax=Caenorhabditis auriculariae TaxID=2777116 RepID=A0A8S1HQ43_9PELO|nr:unnamed protein product [Caenorhabditis auriculariae]
MTDSGWSSAAVGSGTALPFYTMKEELPARRPTIWAQFITDSAVIEKSVRKFPPFCPIFMGILASTRPMIRVH